MTQVGKVIRVQGRVQGVGFRWSVMTLAKSLNIVGTVENEADGAVIIQAVGEADAMATFEQKVKAGPNQWARVATYEADVLEPLPEFKDFTVTG